MRHSLIVCFGALALALSGCDGCGDNNISVDSGPGGDGGPDSSIDAPTDATPSMLGPEIAVDDPVPGTTGQSAVAPNVASDGTSYFAVWADNRISSRADIFGARISATGALTDMFGIAINTATGRQSTPVAAWVGDRWLVVWNNVGDIAGATVSAPGVVTQLPAIAATAGTEALPAIASNGTSALITWQVAGDIAGAMYTAGTVGNAFGIANTAAAETDSTIAAGTAGYLVAYTEDGIHVRGRLVAAGVPSGASFLISPTLNEQSEPSATFDGTNFIVAYDNLTDIYATRVSQLGVVLDAAGVAIGTGAASQTTPSVDCDGTTCFVTYIDNKTFATTGFDVVGQRFAFDLTLQGAAVPVSAGSLYEVAPTVAAAGTGFLAAWEDSRTGGNTLVEASRISATGAVLDATGILLNANRNQQIDPAIATTAGNQLLVWSDSRSVGSDIYGARYTGPGGTQVGTPAALSNASGDQSTPAVTFDGTQFLAVWADARTSSTLDIYASRISLTGMPVEPTGFSVTSATGFQVGPDVASGGGVSLAVWGDRRSGGFDIYGAIITPTGMVSVPDIMISTAANDQNSPAVVYDAADNVFIVVWSDNRGASAQIYGARVTPAGGVLDPTGVQLSTAANGQFRPDVAVSGSMIVAIWDDRRTDPLGDIYGTRMSAVGGLMVTDAAGVLISGATDQQTSPTIIGLPGTRFLAAWADNRNVGSTGFDIFGVEIDATGAPKTTTGFVISNQNGDENQPTLSGSTSAGAGTAIAYQGYRPAVGTTRVFRRTLFLP